MRRFYVFLIAILALVTLPQKMMAERVVYLMTKQKLNNITGNYYVPSNHAMENVSGNIYKYQINADGTDDELWFRFGISDWNDKQVQPTYDKTKLNVNELGQTVSTDPWNHVTGEGSTTWAVSFDKDTYDYLNIYIDISESGKKVWVDGKKKSDNGGGGSTSTNPLNGRTLTEGYYLVGNFFAYDGSTINYDAPVFKFQQQNAVEYALYLPATLDAHAQVIAVDNLGKITAVYGPNGISTISNAQPLNGKTFTSDNLKANSGANIKDEGNNYWNIETRRTQADGEGQDGSYWITLKLDATNIPISLSFTHNDNRRIAYFISTSKSGTAMAISSIRTDVTGNFNSGKYFGTLYMEEGSEYYAISNDAENNDVLGAGYNNDYGFNYKNYKAINNSIQRPTYNKLFLWGNGGVSLSSGEESTKVFPNNGTFLAYTNEGIHTVEFNSNKGKNDDATHGGMSAEIQDRTGSIVLKSISMVGSAIPGTTTGDDNWDWASTAGDMKWDANENCYKLSLVTTAEDGEKFFRFIGNHKEEINWHEDTMEEADKKARTPYNQEGAGHAANYSDPNEICYTTSKEHHDDDYHIIWNRPAGNWTVRLYIYTYTLNSEPAYRYFYTITENNTIELRDLADVTYKGTTRNVLLRGDYKYFRTWSGRKAWKCNKAVDVFIVKSTGTADAPKFQLSKVNQTAADYTVIPANAGVILAVKSADEEALSSIGQHISAPSATSYNLLRIPMEEATENIPTVDTDNQLRTCVTAQNIPTTREENGKTYSNYLFGFFRAKKGDPENKAYTEKTYDDNDFLMGFWISNGNGSFYSNSAYLPVEKSVAVKMGLGVSHNDYDTTTGAKKMPAILFDFADLDNSITGIKTIVTSDSKSIDDNYYTLSGQRVSQPVAGGTYIYHGKKYIVK